MHIAEILRYPVASFAGESLTECRVDGSGVEGDRNFAALCAETGEVAAPESSRRWQNAPLVSSCGYGLGLCVRAPETAWTSLFSKRTDEVLEEHFGFRVVLRATHPIGARHLVHAPLFQRYPRHPLHIVTTAALSELDTACRGPQGGAVRFRANLVIEATSDEDAALRQPGCRVRCGPVMLRMLEATERCAFVALAQNGASRSPGSLRAVRDRFGMRFGSYAAVERVGRIKVGSPVVFVQDASRFGPHSDFATGTWHIRRTRLQV